MSGAVRNIGVTLVPKFPVPFEGLDILLLGKYAFVLVCIYLELLWSRVWSVCTRNTFLWVNEGGPFYFRKCSFIGDNMIWMFCRRTGRINRYFVTL